MALQHNIRHIDRLLDELGVGSLKNISLRRIWILREFFCEQMEWFETGQSPPSRIVSLAQPHIQPIFRVKANASYEYEGKISLSVENGFVMVHASSFENFNESGDLIGQIHEYRRRRGTDGNRFMRTRSTALVKTGSSAIDTVFGSVDNHWVVPRDETHTKEQQTQAKRDLGERNIVEGKIGQA